MSVTSSTNKLKQKYMENVLKGNLFKSQVKPKLRPIEDRKSFWEAIDYMNLKGGKSEEKSCLFESLPNSDLNEKREFWTGISNQSEKLTEATPKNIRTYQNKKVKDLTRTWQDIVKKADHQDKEKVNSASFLEYYSRINVVEMSGKYENAREVQNDGGNFLVDSLDEEDKSIHPSTNDTNMDQTEKQTKETDVELLCKYIYDYGEQYMDGTGAITFSKLKQVFRGSGNVWSAIEQSKKFEVIDHDGDSAHALEHDDVVVLQVPVFKVVEAFNEIREKQSDKNSAN